MAGSYKHLLGEEGDFNFESIDNMGDAYEACEDCFNIIKGMSKALLELQDHIHNSDNYSMRGKMYFCGELIQNELSKVQNEDHP